jgi:citrate synthase
VTERISAAEAANRLGIKRETLYAYVSRGMLSSERDPHQRGSTFSKDEVAALAKRTRRGTRSGGVDLVIATGLTRLDDDRLSYRGLDVAKLAATTPFELVAEWLWTAQPIGPRTPRWPAPGGTPLEGRVDAINRCRIAVATLAAGDDLRYDLSPEAVAGAGRRMIPAMVGALPPRRQSPGRPRSPYPLAVTLWPRLSPHRPTPGLVATVNAALVLLADHELAASTLAARVAASVRADPYSVVGAGLGVIAGGLHGGASERVVDLFEEIGEPGGAARVIGERLRRGERIPGLGHAVYKRADPRAGVLLRLLRAEDLHPGKWDVVEQVHDLVVRRVPAVVNIDFAIGALAFATDMDRDAGEAVFAIARTAGWLAHAIEEYAEAPARFRPRAAYVGRPS